MNYSRSQRYGRRKKSKGKALIRISILLVLIGFVFYTYRTVGLITTLQGRDGYFGRSSDGRENYLISFVDEELKTNFVISMDNEGPAYLVNIPNHTLFANSNRVTDFKGLYAETGKEGLIEAVEAILDDNLPLSGYMILERQGLENLVETIDGINITLESNFYADPLILTKGTRNLMKESAVKYFSHIDSDYEESFMPRQIQTLQTIFDDYFKWSRSLSLLSGLSKIDGYFDTNMSMRELAWFRNMLDEAETREMHLITIPGELDERDYWVVNDSRVVSTIANINSNTVVFFRDDYAVKVLNGNGIAGIAAGYRDTIHSLGYTNIEATNADHTNYPQTIIHYKGQFRHLAEEIQSAIKVNAQLIESLEYDADITVILGHDIN